MTALLANLNRWSSFTTLLTGERFRLNVRLGVTSVIVAVAFSVAAATPSDAQAVTNFGCKEQVWAATEYRLCTTGDWGSGYNVSTGGWYWYETEVANRSAFFMPWVPVSRRLKWHWIVNGINYGEYYCSVYRYASRDISPALSSTLEEHSSRAAHPSGGLRVGRRRGPMHPFVALTAGP